MPPCDYAAWGRVIGYSLVHADTRRLPEPFRVEQHPGRLLSLYADIDLIDRQFRLGIARAASGETFFQLLDTSAAAATVLSHKSTSN